MACEEESMNASAVHLCELTGHIEMEEGAAAEVEMTAQTNPRALHGQGRCLAKISDGVLSVPRREVGGGAEIAQG